MLKVAFYREYSLSTSWKRTCGSFNLSLTKETSTLGMDKQLLFVMVLLIRSDTDDSLYSYISPLKILFNDFAT